jgi:hypothetical protein
VKSSIFLKINTCFETKISEVRSTFRQGTRHILVKLA